MVAPAWFRLLRAGVFALVCVVLSLAGHDLMAAAPTPLWSGGVALAMAVGVGYCLADRRRPLWWLLLAMAAGQCALHVWFSCTTPALSAGRRTVMAMPGMGHGVELAVSHGAMSAGMLAAHALVSLVVACWLWAGERAAWRLLALLLGGLRILSVLFGGVEPPYDPVPAGGERGRPRTVVLRHVVVRRGPPRLGDVPLITPL
jgi:hypothetical protein